MTTGGGGEGGSFETAEAKKMDWGGGCHYRGGGCWGWGGARVARGLFGVGECVCVHVFCCGVFRGRREERGKREKGEEGADHTRMFLRAWTPLKLPLSAVLQSDLVGSRTRHEKEGAGGAVAVESL